MTTLHPEIIYLALVNIFQPGMGVPQPYKNPGSRAGLTCRMRSSPMWLSLSAVRGGKKSFALGGSPYSGCTEATAAISNAAVTRGWQPYSSAEEPLQCTEGLHLRCSFTKLRVQKQPQFLVWHL